MKEKYIAPHSSMMLFSPKVISFQFPAKRK